METLTIDVSKWVPIESAPKEGTEILVVEGNVVRIVIWAPYDDFNPNSTKHWCVIDSWDGEMGTANTVDAPTHWQPLPAPPTTQEGDKK